MKDDKVTAESANTQSNAERQAAKITDFFTKHADFFKAVREEDFKQLEQFDSTKIYNEFIQDLGSIVNEMAQDNQSTVSLTDDEKHYIYNLGVKYFRAGNYVDAITLFRMLYYTDNKNYLYAKALAGSLHADKNYFDALLMYLNVFMQCPQDEIDCMFYVGVCLFELKQYMPARFYLDSFFSKVASDDDIHEDHKKLKARAKMYLKSIDYELSLIADNLDSKDENSNNSEHSNINSDGNTQKMEKAAKMAKMQNLSKSNKSTSGAKDGKNNNNATNKANKA